MSRTGDASKQIKIADKVSNLRDVLHAPPEDWGLKRRQDYVSWAKAVYEGLRGVNEELEIFGEPEYLPRHQTIKQ